MAYRLLTIEELALFQKEFIDFLVINGIDADEWEKIKIREPKKTDEIIAIFSRFIFESVFKKVKYLDFISEFQIKSFQCLNEKIILVGLDSGIKITNKNWGEIQKHPQTKLFFTEKEYQTNREEELFNMVQNGAQISDGDWFKKLSLALAG